MKDHTLRMTMLYDFYGDLLTERQRELFDLYYNEDLSLAEIAEHYGITRQGVRDIIVRAEASLTELEEKTGIIHRFLEMAKELDSIEQAAQELLSINQRLYENQQLQLRIEQILSLVAKLRE